MAAMPDVIELGQAIVKFIEARVAENSDEFPGVVGVPGSGPHPLFSKHDFVARMVDAGAEYKGTAHSLFALVLNAHAVPGIPANMHEVQRYRAEHYAKLSPDEVPKWEHAIAVAVTQETLSQLAVQPDVQLGLFRKISMDIMVYAFLLEFWQRLQLGVDHGTAWPLNFWEAACHVPLNFTYFPPGPQLEQLIYVKSIQIMEDFRSAEEVFAPKAWQLCRLWSRARDMQVAAGAPADDGVGGATTVLCKVVYSAHSDYVEKGTRCINKRLVADALVLHERAVAAGLGDMLEEAGAEFGPNSPLTAMAKLVKLSQMVTATSQQRKIDGRVLLRRTAQVLLLRLRLGLTAPGEGLTALSKTELPRCMLIAELLTVAVGKIGLDGEPDVVCQWVLGCANEVPQKPSEIEAVARSAVLASARAALAWVRRLLAGSLDDALKEIVHQHLKTKSSEEILAHAKLGYAEAVMPKLQQEAEAQQRQKLAKLSQKHALESDEDFLNDLAKELLPSCATSTQPGTAASSAKPPAAATEPEEASSDEDPAEELDRARHVFAESLFTKYIKLAEQPKIDDEPALWQSTIAGLVEGFGGIQRDSLQCHAWVWDPAGDAEPTLQAGESIWARAPTVDKLAMERFFRAASRVAAAAGPAQLTLSFVPLGGEQVASTATKCLTCEGFDGFQPDHLVVVYQEPKKGNGRRRARMQLAERCLAFTSKAAGDVIEAANNKACDRLRLTATSTLSDTLLHAERRGGTAEALEGATVTLSEKQAVLGESLLRGENAEADPEGLTLLFHQEKLPGVWSEVLHHYRISTLCTGTPASGDMLCAAFDLGVPVAALCKNTAHKEVLHRRLLKHVFVSTVSPASRHYTSDFSLAKNLDLSDRVLAFSSMADQEARQAAKEDQESDPDGDDEEEPDEEEPEAEEPQAVGDLEEEDFEPAKKATKSKAKAKVKSQQAKAKAQKAKAKAQAKSQQAKAKAQKAKAKARAAAAVPGEPGEPGQAAKRLRGSLKALDRLLETDAAELARLPSLPRL
jgi:hypothetical protein